MWARWREEEEAQKTLKIKEVDEEMETTTKKRSMRRGKERQGQEKENCCKDEENEKRKMRTRRAPQKIIYEWKGNQRYEAEVTLIQNEKYKGKTQGARRDKKKKRKAVKERINIKMVKEEQFSCLKNKYAQSEQKA